MGLNSYGKFQELRKRKGYAPHRTGLVKKVDDIHITTYVNLLNARVNVAKSFRGIELEGVGPKTVKGYDAFFQVVLTHSVLERFVRLYGKTARVSTWEKMISPHNPQGVIEEFFELDEGERLFEFLCARLDDRGKPIEDGLIACKNRNSTNVAFISAAIRHIFAHGYLTANVNKANPVKLYRACMLVSDFLLDFMDAEFTKAVDACEHRITAKEATSGPQPATTRIGEE